MASSNDLLRNGYTPGIVVAPNNTASRICGISSTNTTALEKCCGRDGDSQLHEYYCSHYCSTQLSMQDFVDCLIKEGSENEESIVGASPYCQNGITSNITVSLTSFGIPRTIPPRGYLFWILALVVLYTGQALGATVSSLSTDIGRRQSTTCSFDMESNYTISRDSRRISGEFNCQQDNLCVQNIPVRSDITRNNRTFNDASAAEPKYDMFFEMLQNQTGRRFPALSSLELNLDLVVMPGSFAIGFTPLAWCVNGTVSNCADLVGTNNNTHIDACGPLFV